MNVHLPSQPTTFIGRTDELAEISRLLHEPACRLLTLVGSGGIGKTRLALQAATAQISRFPDGVHFVSLQSVASADLMLAAIASVLNIMFYSSEEPRLQIINYLRKRQLLLVLDNFEHLLEATGFLSDLTAASPGIKILTTSRERLNIQEEWALVVEGLAFPDYQTTHALEDYSAVQLFVARAKQVQSTFSLATNAETVKAICQQVEGLPLGIELAASWLRVMTCQQIASQMANNLEFLTTSIRNVPERHRSLRVVFEQSWNLLSDNEKQVLMRLSVFRGGFDLEASEEIAGASLMTLAGLADKSLIRLNASGRYDLHELVRQYAADKLNQSDETITIANRHLTYFMQLAEAGEVHAYGSEQVMWYDRQEAEMDNLRAALEWSLSSHSIESGLRMAAALRWFWEMRGHLNEGVVWIEKLLAASDAVSAPVLRKALHRACEVASQIGYEPQATQWGQEALRLARLADDKWNIAWSLSSCAIFSSFYDDLEVTATALEESIALFRELDDPFGLSHALRRLSIVVTELHDKEYGEKLIREALTDARKADDKNAMAWSLTLLGNIFWRLHRQADPAVQPYEESIRLFREIGDNHGLAFPLSMLADVERARGNFERSLTLFKEVLVLLLRTGHYKYEAGVLNVAGVGNLALSMGESASAIRLIGASYARLQIVTKLTAQDTYPDDITAVQEKVGEEAFKQAWVNGKMMTWEQAITYALEEIPLLTDIMDIRSEQAAHPTLFAALTEREQDVLRLMAEGLSNPQIAEKLVVAIGTVKAHTNNIFGKLYVTNRVQAINRAKELALL